jgi:hypothetical protein
MQLSQSLRIIQSSDGTPIKRKAAQGCFTSRTSKPPFPSICRSISVTQKHVDRLARHWQFAMRLISTKTRAFEEFIGPDFPPYAILSHTWEDGEVSYADYVGARAASVGKKGYAKIDMTIALALGDGLSYVWVDTCCIDKSSSAELTEAINSMFDWYATAEVCYVYLSDLASDHSLDHLHQCRWFTRGWTLQETIAPIKVVFYDQAWSVRGKKDELVDRLESITGIDKGALRGTHSLDSFSVAHKMSWAASRTTTRVEDTAYCLLGIFGVNLPLLYGEGTKAFRRLQEEIIRTTPDLTIFAWRFQQTEPGPLDRTIVTGVLASDPSLFWDAGKIGRLQDVGETEFTVSNQGIRLDCSATARPIMASTGSSTAGYGSVLPVCLAQMPASDGGSQPSGICLRKCGYGHFVRQDPYSLVDVQASWPTRNFRGRYLLTTMPGTNLWLNRGVIERSLVLDRRSRVLQLEMPPELTIGDVWPWNRFDLQDRVFFLVGDSDRDCGMVRLRGNEPLVRSIDCLFIGLRWKSLGHMYASIMSYRQYDIKGIPKRLEAHHSSAEVARTLLDAGIAQTTCSKWEMKYGTATVEFEVRSVLDATICCQPFHRVIFHVAYSQRRAIST